MRSLRARLVLGSALVAIVPLALVMILFSWQIERLVRAQAADRLQAAILEVSRILMPEVSAG